MSTHSVRPAVDVAPNAPARPGLALALALISIPGVTIAWDIGAVVGFAGTAIGIAAIVLGLQARNRLTEPRDTNGGGGGRHRGARRAVGRVLPDRRPPRLRRTTHQP